MEMEDGNWQPEMALTVGEWNSMTTRIQISYGDVYKYDGKVLLIN
jgi:hypothetical protein